MKGEDAMGKTANYGLPKWEKSDFIKMDDFNAAFGKIDETLSFGRDQELAELMEQVGGLLPADALRQRDAPEQSGMTMK